MRISSIFQVLIIFLILLSVIYVYKEFFRNENFVKIEEKKEFQNDEVISNNDEDISSVIVNLEYKSFDTLGNKYIIKSKSAKKTSQNDEILELQNVSATIYLKDKSPINILSDYAIYDKKSLNTKFFDNVKIDHDDIIIVSQNLDLFYDEKYISLYNINQAKNNNLELFADKIDYNLLTKDLSINMYSSNNKIKINHY